MQEFDPDAPSAGEGLFGLPFTPETAMVVVIPVPFEATASYRRGTSNGPAAIREASMQVDLWDLETGDAWRAGIAAEDEDARFAAWNNEASELALQVIAHGARDPGDADRAARVDAIMTRMNDLVHEKTKSVLDSGRVPGIIGGDHSVPFGAIQAAAERFPGLGVLHVDAHADLREAYEGFTWSHASVLHNVVTKIPGVAKLVQVGIRDVGERERAFADTEPRIDTWYQPDVEYRLAGGDSWRHLVERMIDPLPKRVWVTFDIDGLDPSLCPSTGTPVPGGLTWPQACVLLRCLGESEREIVGFDLNEVTPGDDGWDAIVGARLLYKLCGWAIRTRQPNSSG
jgi:agmatinase